MVGNEQGARGQGHAMPLVARTRADGAGQPGWPAKRPHQLVAKAYRHLVLDADIHRRATVFILKYVPKIQSHNIRFSPKFL